MKVGRNGNLWLDLQDASSLSHLPGATTHCSTKPTKSMALSMSSVTPLLDVALWGSSVLAST